MSAPLTPREGVVITPARLRRAITTEELLARAVEDYDRRSSHWWGRFLLWLLRNTT